MTLTYSLRLFVILPDFISDEFQLQGGKQKFTF